MTTQEDFKQKGYIVIRNCISASEIDRLYQYTLDRVTKGNMDDGQVPGSPSFYLDPEVNQLQQTLRPMMEEHIGVKLLPVFCYNRVYRTGAVLRIHKDSHRAEISTTMNLGQQGEPWDLWLVDYNENAVAITLHPGDALLYYGNRLHHWRGKLEHADLVSQIMFHFVDANGKNTFASKMEWVRKLRKRGRQLMGLAY